MIQPVVITSDAIYIYDDNGTEIVSWTEQEWIDDPSIVPSICNAIYIRLTEGAQGLREAIWWGLT